ncbi:hypothetical protein CHS0354_021996 [Potamilus streckersoni]|uniref:B box-type domain-containing protein n=1 Tax=Potamilus streckersoni TaxID=2493646 RepID=A0AAE0VYA1_9BIVA|nr:hypothetical protein CHS0354_021996 [Potamilus streckersoni]
MNVASENYCSIHQEEDISYFCSSHDALCCMKCYFSDHKHCCKVVDIESHEKETLDRNSQHLINELKRIEEYLLQYIETNQRNLYRLKQNIKNVLISIKIVKDRVLELIDNLLRDVEQQTKRIYDDEFAKKSEDNDDCHSLLAEVQNSTQRLDSVIQNRNKTQKFLTEYQEQRHVFIIRDQAFSKYGKLESKSIKFTMCDNLKSLLSLRDSELGTVETEDKIETIRRIHRTLDDGRHLKINRCLDLWRILYSPDYTGAALLSTNYVILTDKKMKMCCLYDSLYRHISHYQFSTDPGDVCLFNDEEIAVSLPNEKKIQFLTCTVRVPNGKFKFTPISSFSSKYYCDGLTALGKDKVVISGYRDTGNKNYFWGIWTTSGKEECYHEIDQKGGKGTYLATNNSTTCIYMSCFDIDTVFCFGLDGHMYFKYKNAELAGPMGIDVDRDGNVYVVGRWSQNIHQVSPVGCLIKIISSGILTAPQKIAFSVDGLTSLITNQGEVFITITASNGDVSELQWKD